MRVHSFLVVLTTLSACNRGSAHQREDAAPAGLGSDAHSSSDAASSAGTDVTGSLGGQSFELKNAAVAFQTTSDPRNWVCVSSIAMTIEECEQTNSMPRTMFLGPFVYDNNGNPKWDVAETALYRVGSNALTELAVSGSVTVAVDNASAGALQLTLNVNFGDTKPTIGTVMIGM